MSNGHIHRRAAGSGSGAGSGLCVLNIVGLRRRSLGAYTVANNVGLGFRV